MTEQPQVELVSDKPEQQLEHLKKNIESRITGIDSKRKYYRKRSFFVYIFAAVLTTISTILLGLKLTGEYAETIRITVIVISGGCTLLNLYSAFYDFKELWVANTTALNRFYQLKFDLEFYEQGNSQIAVLKVDEFKKSYQSILNDLNQVWQKSRMNGQTK